MRWPSCRMNRSLLSFQSCESRMMQKRSNEWTIRNSAWAPRFGLNHWTATHRSPLNWMPALCTWIAATCWILSCVGPAARTAAKDSAWASLDSCRSFEPRAGMRGQWRNDRHQHKVDWKLIGWLMIVYLHLIVDTSSLVAQWPHVDDMIAFIWVSSNDYSSRARRYCIELSTSTHYSSLEWMRSFHWNLLHWIHSV